MVLDYLLLVRPLSLKMAIINGCISLLYPDFYTSLSDRHMEIDKAASKSSNQADKLDFFIQQYL